MGVKKKAPVWKAFNAAEANATVQGFTVILNRSNSDRVRSVVLLFVLLGCWDGGVVKKSVFNLLKSYGVKRELGKFGVVIRVVAEDKGDEDRGKES